MLVLSRKIGESIIINENIMVKVVSIDGDSVKIGIEAPREVSIFRNELYDAVKTENEGAVVDNKNLDLSELTKLFTDVDSKK